jgi:hypothetical protein
MDLLRHVSDCSEVLRAGQDSTVTAQGRLLMAQVKIASAQVREWK